MSTPVFAAAGITPTSIAAGDSQQFVIRLEVGAGFTEGPSRIVFDCPGQIGFSRPCQGHQEQDGFIRAYVENPDVGFRLRVFDVEGMDFVGVKGASHRGMAARFIVLDLDGGLKPGDEIRVHWGETTEGYGTGTRATHVVPKPDFECSVEVRYFADQNAGLPDLGRDYHGYVRPKPDAALPLTFRVLPRATQNLRLLRSPRRALLLPLDRYTNISGKNAADLVDCDQEGTANELGATVYADKNVRVVSRGLPLADSPTMDRVFGDMNLYWGDIHTHSCVSNDCIERERLTQTPSDLMIYAREHAGLDFYAVTDHHEPSHLMHGYKNGLTESQWGQICAAAVEHNEPGTFLALAGYEFRCPRGDSVHVFPEPPAYAAVDREDWKDVRDTWSDLQDLGALSIAHFHNNGRLPEDDWWFCETSGVEPVLEIFSCHGSYERPDVLEHEPPLVKKRRPDRTGLSLLRQGHRYGLVANSDGHKGHVGSNGVTAVFAEELTAEAIFSAYREKRVYGTTNARIRLVFTANGSLMGSELPDTAQKAFHIDVMGENRLKKVELFRNGELHTRFAPKGLSCREDLAVSDDGPGFWYVRATQVDNHVAWSSPIWFG